MPIHFDTFSIIFGIFSSLSTYNHLKIITQNSLFVNKNGLTGGIFNDIMYIVYWCYHPTVRLRHPVVKQNQGICSAGILRIFGKQVRLLMAGAFIFEVM